MKQWLTGSLLLMCASAPFAAQGRAGTVAAPLPSKSHAAVFMYNHFGVSKYPDTNVRLEQFDAHLDYLAQAGYQVWSLERVVEYLRTAKPIPDKTVVITIDDGPISTYTQAYPRLRKRGWPFTVFIYTDAIDQRLPAYITWDQMREMQKHGGSFANQSTRHDHMIRKRKGESVGAWEVRMRADITHAQRRIEKELGTAPMLFSYPYGEYNTALAEIVKDLGYAGIGEQSGPVGAYSDLRVLPRYPVSETHANIKEFRTKAASLALPVSQAEPWDPALGADGRPRMVVTLAPSDARLEKLACFVSGQGEAKVEWIDKGARRFAVRAARPLGAGRSRYNCSAPAREPGRYYWFSHLWIGGASLKQSPAQQHQPTSDQGADQHGATR